MRWLTVEQAFTVGGTRACVSHEQWLKSRFYTAFMVLSRHILQEKYNQDLRRMSDHIGDTCLFIYLFLFY